MLKDELPKIVTQTVPGPKAAAVLARRRQAIPDAIGTIYPTVIQRGEGAMFEDIDGNYFLDWVGGVGVLNIGYSQPEVVKAVQDQAGHGAHQRRRPRADPRGPGRDRRRPAVLRRPRQS